MGTRRAKLEIVRSPAPTPTTDTELETLDTTDLDAVFRRYAPYVAGIGARILGRTSEVDDLVQDVFLDATRGLKALREPDAIRGWLATVAVRHARRRLRRARLWGWFGGSSPIEDVALADPGGSPEDRAQLVAVYRALDRVAPEARIAWVLSTVEGHALEEVAAIGGFSRATAHRRIQEARAAIEEALHGT